MDAVTLLNEHVEIEKLLEHYDFNKMKSEGSMIRSCCKLHDGNNPTAFVVNIETGLWFCHTSDCGGGDIYTLVQKMEELSFSDAVKWVASFFHVDIANLEIAERKAAHVQELKKWVKLMRDRSTRRIFEPFTISEDIREVSKFREFRPETLEKFGLGHVNEVTLRKRDDTAYTLKNRLVIPIIQNGVQIGMSFRRVRNSDIPKWSHQPAHIQTGELLYNYDAVQGEMKIAVVEGIFDVWAYDEIGVPAVCTYGAHLTDAQYRLLIKTGADLVFSFDADEAGDLATQKAINLFRFKANMETVNFQSGEDPENIPRELLNERYRGKTKRL